MDWTLMGFPRKILTKFWGQCLETKYWTTLGHPMDHFGPHLTTGLGENLHAWDPIYCAWENTEILLRFFFIYAEVSVIFAAIQLFRRPVEPLWAIWPGLPLIPVSNFYWDTWTDKNSHFFQVSEVEVLSARNELKLAVRRAEDLQVSKITLFHHDHNF